MKNTNVYKANLKALKYRFPSLYQAFHDKAHAFPFPNKIILTKNNEVNVTVAMPDGRSISFYEEEDILEQTRKILSAHELHKHDILMCIGMGLGYLPLTAVQTYTEKPKIVVVERYAEVFDLAMHVVDLRRLFSYENLDLFVGGEFSVHDMVSYYRDILYAGTCRRVVHRASRQIFGQNILLLEKEIDENINTLLLNWNTIRLHGQKVMHNAMNNLSSLFESVQIGELRDRFKGMPAICVASGPSLSKDLPAIKQLADKALILACDSAVKPLAAAGITPHMIFVVDHDTEDFEKIRTEVGKMRQSILVFFVEANVDSVRGFLGEKRIFVSAGTSVIEHWLGPDLRLHCGLDGTVSSNGDSAVLTAVALGADPIVLVGMDLAFSNGQDHADGCAFRCEQEDDLLTLTGGVKGLPVYSLPAMITGKILLEKIISSSRRRFIDSSLNGALINGTEIKSLTELAQTEYFGHKDFRQALDAIIWQSTMKRADIETSLKKMALKVSGLKKAAFEGLIIIKNRFKIHETEFLKHESGSPIDRGLAHYQHLTKRFDEMLNLINCMRYEKQLETDRKIIHLGRDKELSKEKLHKDTLAILKNFFSSVYRSSRLFEKLLIRQKIYFEKASALRTHIENHPDDVAKRMELARVHTSEDIVWMAVKEYQQYLKKVPEDCSAWAELIQSYMDIKLWKEARETLQQAMNRFPDQQRLIKLDNELNDGLKMLMATARREMINSKKGDKFGKLRARHAIMNYLYAMPDDPEAKDIEMQIQEHDNLENRRIEEKSRVVFSPEKLQELIDKTRWCVSSGKEEQAVGIYEGLISAYPENFALYREKIGDIRFGQKDFLSALWNYQQALECSPQNSDLQNRIQWARPLVGARGLLFEKCGLTASIIVPFEGDPRDIIRLVADLVSLTTVSHEIILIISADDTDALGKIRGLAKAHRNIHVVSADFAPDSPQSINAAIFSSTGNHIVFLPSGVELCPKWLETLLDHVSANPLAGLVQPIVTYSEKPMCKGISLLFSENEQTFRHRRRPMTSCNGFFVLFKRELLARVGLMDETINCMAVMLEDFRARCAMEGFDNIIAADVQTQAKGCLPAENDKKRFEHKWGYPNLPQYLKEKIFRLALLQEIEKKIQNGEPDLALSRLINAIAVYPKSDWIYCTIARVLITENRCEDALEALNAILPESHDAENAIIRNGFPPKMSYEKSALRALALARMGKTQEAQTHLDLVDQINPDLSIALFIHATLSLKQKSVKTAEAYFRKALSVDPGFGAAYAGLSELFSATGDGETAFELLRKAFALSPDAPDILSAFHFAAIERGCYEEAEILFNEGVKLFPDNKRLHYLRIDVMLRQQKYGTVMDKIDDAIIRFGPADGILEAAEHIRKLAASDTHPQRSCVSALGG